MVAPSSNLGKILWLLKLFLADLFSLELHPMFFIL